MMHFAHIAVAAIAALSAVEAGAIDLLRLDDNSFGQITQGRNDDGSSGLIDLPFDINFFGNTYGGLFVNNNGNVTFGGPLGSFTPSPFPISSQPMIAPYWADVDTRNPASGQVYIGALGINNRQSTIVTWDDVGYYSNNADKLNSFQLALIDRNDTGTGNFDIQFRYDRLEWTTGSASGGSNGLGGTPAQAGYDAGDRTNFFTLPGSRSAAVLDLDDSSNVSLDTPGLWAFQIRNGEITDGGSPATPLLPTVVTEAGFEFSFSIPPGRPIFIDPEVAIGYDYVVTSGPAIDRVWFGDVGDADGYQLFGWDGDGYDSFITDIAAETWFEFAVGGVTRFAVRGIDAAIGLDPQDPTAFVTGLVSLQGGDFTFRMTPVTTFVGGGVVPEPATWLMMIAGFGLVGGMARSRRPQTA